MTEQALTVAREAKGLQQGLKETLKTREPWDKEVEFQRKNLRRQYLRLLLVHPYAKESKDAETHLWMQTSYAFITVYRQKVAALDRRQQRPGGPGPVEYRKLVQRFRQFLADEEKFWTQLVVRFRRSFALDEAQSALEALGILTTADDTSADITDPRDAHNGRSHFQFPLEDSNTPVEPTTDSQRDSRLALVSKSLICLGDIARYRELYNESGGRSKVGHGDSGPPRNRNKGGRGGAAGGLDAIPRARNYEKAQQCYEQARLLVPYDGNASHQLAILASYQKDIFFSLFHYYRALCVRQPYDTASENLGTILSKALDQWKVRIKQGERDKEAGMVVAPKIRIETFKDNVVILHALWRLGVEKMDAISSNHSGRVHEEFHYLVSDRHLPTDLISKPIVLSQGALWKHRMIGDPTSTSQFHHAEVEPRIFTHVLTLHQILMEIGLHELAEPPPRDADAENDLAQRITAVFRRTLPALRISGKWLRANFKYVMQNQDIESSATTSNTKPKGKGGIRGVVFRFWDTYARFSCALSRAFPLDKLPSLTALLEEDVEMRGFLPLRKMMGEVKVTPTASQKVQTPEQVHPNVEQLMRISDILNDVKALVEMEDSPIALYGNRFVLKGIESVVPVANGGTGEVPMQPGLLTSIRDTFGGWRNPDEDAMTETTDPVGDAFRQALDGSDKDVEEDNDDEDDEIVWDPRATVSPVLPSSPVAQSPVTPVRPTLSPIGHPSRSPSYTKKALPASQTTAAVTAAAPTTAQDLLNSVMGLPSRIGAANNAGAALRLPESYASQPQLLFGSAPPNLPGHSIWSTSLDDQSLQFVGSQPGHGYPSHIPQQQHFPESSPMPPSSLQDYSQSPWMSSSSYTNASQNSQSHLVGAIPSAPFVQQPHSFINNHHQRVPSATVAPALFSNQPDQFAYNYQNLRQQTNPPPPLGSMPVPPMYAGSPLTPHISAELLYGPGNGQVMQSGYHPQHPATTRQGQYTTTTLSQGGGAGGWANAG